MRYKIIVAKFWFFERLLGRKISCIERNMWRFRWKAVITNLICSTEHTLEASNPSIICSLAYFIAVFQTIEQKLFSLASSAPYICLTKLLPHSKTLEHSVGFWKAFVFGCLQRFWKPFVFGALRWRNRSKYWLG